MQRLGVRGSVRRGRQDLLARQDADRLRAEYDRVRRLHERAMRQAEAARVLGVKARTLRGWIARGEKLAVDPETDSSRATFVTRASVAALQRGPADRPATIPKRDVARRLGASIRQVDSLIRRCLLATQLVDRQQQVVAESLDDYIESTALSCLAGDTRQVGAETVGPSRLGARSDVLGRDDTRL